MQAIQFTDTVQAHTCGECGVVFGMTVGFIDARKEDHKTFYCPNGHPRMFTAESRAEKLQKQLDAAKRREGWAESRAQSYKDQADTAEARRRAQKAANTRLKKRIAAGICPCCHRNFQDLRRHMDGQHPTFAEGDQS